MKDRIRSILLLVLIPVFFGLVLHLSTNTQNIAEVVMTIVATIQLIIYVRRISKLERKNLRNRGTYKSDKKSVEYIKYKDGQNTLLIAIVINYILAYLAFLFLGV